MRWVIAVLFAALILRPIEAAPVPSHLFPPPPRHPVQVGFRWYFQNHVLIVHEINGDLVTFRNLTDPERTFPPLDGGGSHNQQSRNRCLEESRTYGVPPRD